MIFDQSTKKSKQILVIFSVNICKQNFAVNKKKNKITKKRFRYKNRRSTSKQILLSAPKVYTIY